MKEHFTIDRKATTRVAVLVSLYNYDRYICEALDSVAAQTLEDIELVVCDDCSTDHSVAFTMDWMRKHEARFPRMALIGQDVNSGLTATRHLSMSYSVSPYLFILDADNLIYPACLERSLEIIEESEPEAAFVYTQREIFNDESPNEHSLENLPDWSVPLFSKGNYIDAMVLHKRSALDAVGGYTTDAFIDRCGWQDFELWLKYAQHGFYGIKIHQPLIRYRCHSASMLHTVTDGQKQEMLWERMCKLYPEILSPKARNATPN